MKLTRDFYTQPTLAAAKDLLGKIIVRKTNEGTTKCRIVETEAYMGIIDKAAHSYKGRTKRTGVLFETSGCVYVYMIYGMYFCLNISTGDIGIPECVLIRAAEPVSGLELMAKRRGTDKIRKLCSGPGMLCAAMDISMAQYGTPLYESDELYITEGTAPDIIDESPRINIGYAGEAALYPWRFTVRGSQYLSR